MKKILLVLMCMSMAFGFCGCSRFSRYREDDGYVSEVRHLTDEIVKYTRIWNEKDEEFNCLDSESSGEYIRTLEEVEQICKKLLSLIPSEKFGKDDDNVKSSARKLLYVTSEIKEHIKYAVETEDDVLFQKEKSGLFATYMESYEELAEDSQYLQMFWRNA